MYLQQLTDPFSFERSLKLKHMTDYDIVFYEGNFQLKLNIQKYILHSFSFKSPFVYVEWTGCKHLHPNYTSIQLFKVIFNILAIK